MKWLLNEMNPVKLLHNENSDKMPDGQFNCSKNDKWIERLLNKMPIKPNDESIKWPINEMTS